MQRALGIILVLQLFIAGAKAAALGETCTADSDCTPAICDGVTGSKTCKLNVGQSCASTNSGNCKSGTTCDTGDICKLNAGQSCASTNSGNCKSGTTCDTGDICRIKQGVSCTSSPDSCVSGATCSTNCACNTNLTTVNTGAGTCSPKTNIVGGTCTAATGGAADPCAAHDPNSVCDTSTCKCPATTFQVKAADLTCEVPYGQACSATKPCTATTNCYNSICKRNVGETCGTSTECSGSNVECSTSTSKCACKSGSANTNKSDCPSSAVIASLSGFLLLVVLIVTSRFV